MKNTFLTLGLFFCANVSAIAQLSPPTAAPADSTAKPQTVAAPAQSGMVVQRVTTTPTPRPMLTAADSSSERARRENARQLRKSLEERKAATAVAPAPTVPATPDGHADSTEIKSRERIREQEHQRMIKEALQKKGYARKQAKKGAATSAASSKSEKAKRK